MDKGRLGWTSALLGFCWWIDGSFRLVAFTKISRARSSPRQVSHHSRAEPSGRLVSNGGKTRPEIYSWFLLLTTRELSECQVE